MRNQFNEQLRELHDDLLEMGNLCEEAISTAIRTLTENDRSLVADTNTLEERIDRQEHNIEALCLKVLLLQTPIASDLRRVSAAMRMITDMERIGDQAADIAEISRFIHGARSQSVSDIKSMAEATVTMVGQAVDSFVRQDMEAANRVIRHDDIVDDWFTRIKVDLIKEISAASSSDTSGEIPVDLLMIAKYLERIGDHATNIAEWVQFSISGALPGDEDG